MFITVWCQAYASYIKQTGKIDPEAYFANQALWTVGPEYWAMKFKSLASLPGRCPGSGLSRTFSISTFNGGPDYMGARTTSAIPKSIHQ